MTASDCVDEEWLTTSWVERELFTNEPGRGIGFRIKDDVIVHEPNLLNQDMGLNPQESHLVDIDSDGDLDLYLNGTSSHCGVKMCLYENTGDFEMKAVDTGIWAQAYDENFAVWAEKCQGPQNISEGQWDNQLCDLELSQPATQEYIFTTTQPSIADLDGDGKFDIYSIQRQTGDLTIIYGE